MNSVTKLISQELDFNVTRTLEEAFNEDSAVTECGFGFAYGTFERILEVGLFADNTHTTSSTTHGGLDDDYDDED